MKVVSFSFPFLLLSVFLCNICTVSGFLTAKCGIPQPTHVSSIEKSWTMKNRGRTQQVSMLDDATIGGILAGVSGLSLGIGAMVFTEGQQERRRERQAARRTDMFTQDSSSSTLRNTEASATITEDTPGSVPTSPTSSGSGEQGKNSNPEKVSDDGW